MRSQRPTGSRARLALSRPIAIASIVVLGYLGWAGYYLHYHSIESVAHVGSRFQQQGHGSRAIDGLAGVPTEVIGYDGQFFYFIALDPTGARTYLDHPSYRYSRPVYPLAARALALGRPGAVPWALLLLGIAGIAAGTFACAAMLQREDVSPWYGALYGLYPGLFVAVTWDLSESLAYGLAALGLLLYGRDGRRLLPAAVLFGVAGATRESTLLFPIAIAIWLVASRHLWRAALLTGVSLAPLPDDEAGAGAVAPWRRSRQRDPSRGGPVPRPDSPVAVGERARAGGSRRRDPGAARDRPRRGLRSVRSPRLSARSWPTCSSWSSCCRGSRTSTIWPPGASPPVWSSRSCSACRPCCVAGGSPRCGSSLRSGCSPGTRSFPIRWRADG